MYEFSQGVVYYIICGAVMPGVGLRTHRVLPPQVLSALCMSGMICNRFPRRFGWFIHNYKQVAYYIFVNMYVYMIQQNYTAGNTPGGTSFVVTPSLMSTIFSSCYFCEFRVCHDGRRTTGYLPLSFIIYTTTCKIRFYL